MKDVSPMGPTHKPKRKERFRPPLVKYEKRMPHIDILTYAIENMILTHTCIVTTE